MRIHLRPRYQLFKSFYLIYPKLFVELYRGGSRTAGTSKVELFVTIFNSWKPLNIITTSSTLDVAVVLYPPLIWIKTWLIVKHLTNGCYRSSHSEVFRGKGVLTICSKFTGEHPCRHAISIKLQLICPRLPSQLHSIWHEILRKLRIFPKENYIKHYNMSQWKTC